MNSKYKIVKFRENKFENVDDFISIEEPLEISIRYKEHDKWIKNSLSITMRTPGHDEDLVRGFLFNEQIVKSINDIDSILNASTVGDVPYTTVYQELMDPWQVANQRIFAGEDVQTVLDEQNAIMQKIIDAGH